MRYVLDAIYDIIGKLHYVAIKDTDIDSIQVYGSTYRVPADFGYVYGQTYTWVELIEKSKPIGNIDDLDTNGLLGYSEECGYKYFSVVDPEDFKAYQSTYLRYKYHDQWFSYLKTDYNGLAPLLWLNEHEIYHIYINQKTGIALQWDSKTYTLRAVTLNELTGYAEPQPYEATIVYLKSWYAYSIYMRFVLKEGHLCVDLCQYKEQGAKEGESLTYTISFKKDHLFYCEVPDDGCQGISYDADMDLPILGSFADHLPCCNASDGVYQDIYYDADTDLPVLCSSMQEFDIIAMQPNGIGVAHIKNGDTDRRKALCPLHLTNEEFATLVDRKSLDWHTGSGYGIGIGAHIWNGDINTQFKSADGTLAYTESAIVTNAVKKSRYILKRNERGYAYCFDKATGTKITKEQLGLICATSFMDDYLNAVDDLERLIKKNLPQNDEEFVRRLRLQSMFLGHVITSAPEGFIIANAKDIMHWDGGGAIKHELCEQVFKYIDSDWLLCVSGNNICWAKNTSCGFVSVNIASMLIEISMFEGINDLGVEDLDNFVDYSGFLFTILNRR